MPRSRRAAEVFQQRLRAARIRLGWSQAELADRAGMQAAAISHFETGARKPSFDNLRRLSDALRVTTDFLIGRTKDPEIVWKPNDPLYRHAEQLNDADRELAREYLALLAKRSRKNRQK